MTPLEETSEILTFSSITGLIRRHILFVLLAVPLFAGIGYLISDYIPAKYKATAVLGIQSGYFQNPLVSDLISEVHDPSELNAERLSLLRLALNEQFLDMLGREHNLYKHSPDSPLRALDREELLKKIEYFSVNPTSFQISISNTSAHEAYTMVQEVLDQMTSTLIHERYQTLVQARDAILKQAKLLNSTLNDSSTPERSVLEEKLAVMENNLTALRQKFTDNHPEVVRLAGQAKALQAQIGSMPARRSDRDDYTNVFLSPASHAPTQAIFDDLLKKLSHLNIVLEMERDRENVSYLTLIERPSVPARPYFPNPLQFALFGAVFGLAFSAIRIIYSELRNASILAPEQASAYFGIELLGTLPPLSRNERVALLDAHARHGTALQLPSPES